MGQIRGSRSTAAAVLLLALAGCGTGTTTTVTVEREVAHTPPPPTTAAGPQTPADRPTGTIGDTLQAGDVGYKLVSVRRVRAVAGLVPSTGAEFVLLRVRWTNGRSQPTTMFCIAPAARLVSRDGDEYNPNTKALVSLPGDACGDLQPGLSRTDAVLFEIPGGTRLDSVAFWDGSSPDPRSTIVQFEARV